MDHLFHLWSSGVLLFCTTVGWEALGGRSFSWGDGCLVRISLQYFSPRKYTQHIPWGHIFSEKPFQHWNMLFCVFCLCCFAADSTDPNCSRGQEKDKTIKVEYCLDDKSTCFCFHLSSSHFIWTFLNWKGSLHPFPRKKHKSTPSQKYK